MIETSIPIIIFQVSIFRFSSFGILKPELSCGYTRGHNPELPVARQLHRLTILDTD